MRFDRKQFFDGVRAKLLSQLTQGQVDGIEFLLGAFESDERFRSIRKIAYAFATVAHETAWTFKPIKEYRNSQGSAGRKNQDRYWLSGYYGRGYVQLTWLENYVKASRKLNINLEQQPDRALQPDVAFKILSLGMTEGWFTGKKLDDYITETTADYVGARKIINGTDKAVQIAGYAKRFEAILRMSQREEAFADLDESEINIEIPTSSPAAEPRQEPQSNPQIPQNAANAAIPQAEAPQNQTADVASVETVTVDAPPPTGFLAKLKWHIGTLGIGTGTIATVKELTGVQIGAETVELLKIVLPTILGLGFLGFLVWYISEKVIGFKTLQLKANFAADPRKNTVEIKPQ